MKKQCDEDGYIDDPDAHYEQPDDGGGLFVFGVIVTFIAIAVMVIRSSP